MNSLLCFALMRGFCFHCYSLHLSPQVTTLLPSILPPSHCGESPAAVSTEDPDPCFTCLSYCKQITCQGARLPWPRSSAVCGRAMPGSPLQSCLEHTHELTELPAHPASPSHPPRSRSCKHQPEALGLPCVRKSNTFTFPSHSHCRAELGPE